MNWPAVRTTALLALLFLVVYIGTNWVTTQRSDVGTWSFGWEQHIPFISWMALPYLSIDLFFVSAPFFCRSNDERRVLARRVAYAILVAGLFFLVMPLRLCFETHAPTDAIGTIFNAFCALDEPHNLFPSLHIALSVVLAEHFARQWRGWRRTSVIAWFALVALSTLFTHRHHVVDVFGGAALGVTALYFFRLKEQSTEQNALTRDVSPAALLPPQPRSPRLTAYYALGSAACVALSLIAWPLTSLLLWPALALAIIAMAYAGAGTRVFRKTQGALAWSARIVLAPVLVGQWLSWRWYARQSRAWDEVIPGLWIGRTLTRREARRAIDTGLVAVLDLTSEGSEVSPLRELEYLNIQVMDLTAPSAEQTLTAIEFIARQMATRSGADAGTQSGTDHGEVRAVPAAARAVMVHCKAGYSRSAVIVAAYLVTSGHAQTPERAIARLREVRPRIVIRPEALRAIVNSASVPLTPRAATPRTEGDGRTRG